MTSSSSLSVTKSSSSLTKSSESSSFSMYDIGVTVLKLTWGTRVVNFAKLEVDKIEITTARNLDLQRLQTRQPIVYELSGYFKIVNLVLNEYLSPMTMAKLEAVRKVRDIITLTMYYSDGVTQAEQFDVRIDPGAKSHYLKGHRSAQDPLGAVFYEAVAG